MVTRLKSGYNDFDIVPNADTDESTAPNDLPTVAGRQFEEDIHLHVLFYVHPFFIPFSPTYRSTDLFKKYFSMLSSDSQIHYAGKFFVQLDAVSLIHGT